MVEEHARAQPLANLERLRDVRWLHLEQSPRQPVVVASPTAEKSRTTAFVLLPGSQAFDGLERLERVRDGLFLPEGLPHQTQPRLPGEREERPSAARGDQR